MEAASRHDHLLLTGMLSINSNKQKGFEVLATDLVTVNGKKYLRTISQFPSVYVAFQVVWWAKMELQIPVLEACFNMKSCPYNHYENLPMQ